MLRQSDVSGLIWRLYTISMLFMVFLSFSSENAGDGFYPKYYAFLILICMMSALPISSDFLTYLHTRRASVFFYFAFVGTIFVWNFIVSDFQIFYSLLVLATSLVGGTIFVIGRVRPNLMMKVIRTVILVNVLGLIYQYMLFAATGTVPYLHGELFPFSRDSYMLTIAGGFDRFTGLQMEPGGYSSMITLALIYYRSLSGRVDRTFVLGAMSVVMTFSTVAMIYFAVLVLVILLEVNWSKPRNLAIALSAFFLVIGVLIFGGVIESIIGRFDNGYEGDSSLNVKVLNIISYTQFSFEELISGMGVERIDRDCVGCNFVKSNGVFFYMVYSLGLVGFLFILALLIRAGQNGLACFCFAIVLLLCRYPLNVPVFWLIFLCLWNWKQPFPKRVVHRGSARAGPQGPRGQAAYRLMPAGPKQSHENL